MGFTLFKKSQTPNKNDSLTAEHFLSSSSPPPPPPLPHSPPSQAAPRLFPSSFRSSSNSHSNSSSSTPPLSPSTRHGPPSTSASSMFSSSSKAETYRPATRESLDSNSRNKQQESSWEDVVPPSPSFLSSAEDQPASPTLHPLNRFKLFGSRGGNASDGESVVSLSVPTSKEERKAAGGGAGEERAAEKKKSRWAFGGGTKPRSSSSSGIGLGLSPTKSRDLDSSSSSGFVVTSFRTVSRVHEDPIPTTTRSTGPYGSLTTKNPPQIPSGYRQPSHRSQSSPTLPDDYPSTSSHVPNSSPPLPEPPLRDARRSSTGPPPPNEKEVRRESSNNRLSATISVEAFRLASQNRSRSQGSLTSLDSSSGGGGGWSGLDGATGSSGRGKERDGNLSDRPRFIPAVAPRGRSSFGGEGSSESLIPPRPLYASQGSSSAESSSSNLNKSLSDSGHSVRHKRESSNGDQFILDDDLRLIALYGAGASGSYSPPLPLERKVETTPPRKASLPPPEIHTPDEPWKSSSYFPESSKSTSPSKSNPSMPSLSLHPATPLPSPAPDPWERRSASTGVPRTNSLSPPIPTSSIVKKVLPKGWMVNSSDEEDADEDDNGEDDDDDDDEEDEIPLAKLGDARRASMDDLGRLSRMSLSSSGTGFNKFASSSREQTSPDSQHRRSQSSDLEVLKPELVISGPPQSTSTYPNSNSNNPNSQQEVIGLGQPPQRHPQRRSMSAFFYAPSPTETSSSDPSEPPSGFDPPFPHGPHRTYSNPASPVINSPFNALELPQIPTTQPLSSIMSSPLATTQPLQLNGHLQNRAVNASSSSSSGSGDSSRPRTPKDSPGNRFSTHSSTILSNSTAKTTPATSERNVKFEVAPSLLNDKKWPKKMMLGTGAGALGGPIPRPSSAAGSSSGRFEPRMQYLHPQSQARSQLETRSEAPSRPPRSAKRIPSMETVGNKSKGPSSSVGNATGSGGDVFERMKERHKADTIKALALGRDLNGPEGIRDEEDDDDEEEDGEDDGEENDDAPLASLPVRGVPPPSHGAYPTPYPGGDYSQAYPSYPFHPQAPPHQQYQTPFYPPPSTMGGYSQLEMAPPGVDPALYASLPPDQKMSLQHRAQQMLAMMEQAAWHARAQSVAGGWENESNDGGSVAGGSRPARRSSSGPAGPFPHPYQPQGMPGMGMGMGMPSYGTYPSMPTFAPYGYGGPYPPPPPPQSFYHPGFNSQPPPRQYAASEIGGGGGGRARPPSAAIRFGGGGGVAGSRSSANLKKDRRHSSLGAGPASVIGMGGRLD